MTGTQIASSRSTTHPIQLSLDVDNEPRVDSRWIAEDLGTDHRSTFRLIKRYEEDLKEFGVLRFKIAKPTSKGGRPEEYSMLNEDQSYLLLTLSRNTDRVVHCKKKLVREFGRLRRRAEKRAQIEWQQARLEGKDARRHETDTIKAFVEYAVAQGSKSANMYYMNITKMTHKALGLVEQGVKQPGCLRDLLDGMQLSFLATAEYVAAQALKDGMAAELPYKDIYKMAKFRVTTYASSIKPTSALLH